MFLALHRPDWNREGRQWPNREASRFVEASGLRWHVQVMGSGPTVLLLHGAGAASHSWRDLAPLLARRFTVIVPDLPGHGFTETPKAGGLSLDGMSESLAGLCQALDAHPAVVAGHSAGAAITLRMRLNGMFEQAELVSLNGALQPFGGPAAHIFPAMAKLLFLNPLAVKVFALRASRPGAVAALLERTGSHIDRRGLELYQALLSTTGHVSATLGMMASWNLEALQRDMARFAGSLTLVAADNDRAVPPKVALGVKALIPKSRVISLPNLGHLAHEEAPDLFAKIIIGVHTGDVDTQARL